MIAAALLRIPFDALAGRPMPPFITFYPAVSVIGIACGMPVGFAAVSAALVAAWYFWIPEFNSWRIEDAGGVLSLVLFAIGGSFAAYVGGMARHLLDEVKRREADRSRVARESVHRVKNLISVALALSRQASNANSVEEYRNRLGERLTALARAQDLLVKTDWRALPVPELIHAATDPFHGTAFRRGGRRVDRRAGELGARAFACTL